MNKTDSANSLNFVVRGIAGGRWSAERYSSPYFKVTAATRNEVVERGNDAVAFYQAFFSPKTTPSTKAS